MRALLGAVVLASGCTTLGAVAPAPSRALVGAIPDAPALFVAPLMLDADGELEGYAEVALDAALRERLESAAPWAEASTVAPARELVRVLPRARQRVSVSRTYLLDAMSLMSLGMFPFSLAWGEVEVELSAELSLRDGRPLGEPIRVEVAAAHSTAVHGLFRVDEIEEALRRCYARAFDELALALVARVGRAPRAGPVVTASVATASVAVVASRIEPVRSAVLALASSSLLPVAPEPIFLPPDGFDIVTRPRARGDDDLLSRYVGALGGLEAASFRGGASVESRTFTQNAPDELVGSGAAETQGYRFAFYRPPDRTGFFFPPSVGLLWQDVTIRGFEDEVPLARGGDIPAVASNPTSGAPVDLGEPLSYALRLRSGFLGQGLGLNLVAGNEDVQLFFTLQGHVNLLELRYVNVEVGKNEVEGTSVVGFRSAGLDAQMGLVLPELHLALRVLGQSEWFFDFDFPEPVEFAAATRYVPEKDVFERERAFVRGASVRTYNAQVSLAVLF